MCTYSGLISILNLLSEEAYLKKRYVMYFVSIFPNLSLLCKLIFFIPNVMDLKFSFENTPPSDWHLFLAWFEFPSPTEILPSLLNELVCKASSALILIIMGCDKPLLSPKLKGRLSVFPLFFWLYFNLSVTGRFGIYSR